MPTVHFYNPTKYKGLRERGAVSVDIADPRKSGDGLTKEQRKSLRESETVTLKAPQQEEVDRLREGEQVRGQRGWSPAMKVSSEPLGNNSNVAGNDTSMPTSANSNGGNALASPQSDTDARRADWPLRGIIAPGNNDYLLVRGRSKHPGNAEFHRKIDASNIAFNASSEKKSVATARFVREWREQDPPGRFLKRNIQGLWDDIGDDKAVLTVGLKIRRKQSPKASEGNANSSPLEQSALTVHSSNNGKIPPTNESNTRCSEPTTVVLNTVLSSTANGRESLLATASTAQGATNVAEFAMLASQTVRNTGMLPAAIRPSHDKISLLGQAMVSAHESSGQAHIAAPPTLSFLDQCLTVIGFPWGRNSQPQLAEPLDSMAEDGSEAENRPLAEISENKSLREPMRPLKKRKVVGEETAVQEASPAASENSMPSIAQERRAADQQQLEAKMTGLLENEMQAAESEELAAGLGGKLPGSSLEQKRLAAESPSNESPATADRQGMIMASIQHRKQLLALVRASRVQLERRSECFDDRRLSTEIADFNLARMTAEETARRNDKRRRHHSTGAASASAAEAGTVRPVVGGRVAVTFKEGNFEGNISGVRFDSEQNSHKIIVSWDCGDPDEELSYPGIEGGIRLLGGTDSGREETLLVAGQPEVIEAEKFEQERLLAEESTKAAARERLQEETREAARLEAEKKARLESERQERERLAAKEAARAADQKRLQEAARAAEQERLEAEKKSRFEAELQARLATEEAVKAAEQERMQEAEERARLEAERLARERLAAEVAATAAEKKRLEEEWQTAKKKRLDEEQQLASLQAERQERERLAAKRLEEEGRVAAEQERLEEEKKARRESEQLERKRLAAEEAAEAAEQERMQEAEEKARLEAERLERERLAAEVAARAAEKKRLEERRVAEQGQLEEEKQLASLEPSMLERERIAADRLEEKGPFAEQKQSARFEAAEHEEAKVKAKPDECKPEPSVPTRGSSVIDVEYACLNKPGRSTRSVRKRKIKYRR